MRTNYPFRAAFSVSAGGTPIVILEGVKYFDVGAIFDCGQAFRFVPIVETAHTVEYGGAAFGRYISVAQDGDRIVIYGADEEDFNKLWVSYLGLDFDIESARRDILSRSDNPALASALEYGKGIRLLRQEKWETLCSFIISQNNNIPRIRSLIGTLSKRLGEPIKCTRELADRAGAAGAYSFPTPEAVVEAGEDALREMRFGFRAPYIYDAALRVSGGELDTEDVAKAKTTSEAAELLMRIKGVGPKVAACTLLFGFDRTDAFPIDVWVKRVIAKYFPAPFEPASLGPYAGLAQQYLFYYERSLGGK